MALDDRWVTEACAEAGSAFSLKIRDKLHEEQTAYQTIAVYETEHFGTALFIDGFVQLTDRDNFIYHEMLVHPAMFTHPDPRSVLIVGGGDCGTLREVLKHPQVQSATQVEIDERVTRVAETHFPELCSANRDIRATFRFTDGIRWVADSAADQYDIILIDSTDPIGPAAGLFSEAFYRDCLRALRPGGILAAQSESPLYHLPLILSMRSAMRCAGFSQTATFNFPQCSYPSGWWSITLAANNADLGHFREDDVARRQFETNYYNAAIHRASVASPEFMERALSAEQADMVAVASVGRSV